jgi:cytosine permease
MGLLQIGWYSVGTFYATKLMLGAFGRSDQIGPLFVIVAIVWGYIFALFGAFGIKYVATISSYLPWVAVAMLGIAGVCALPHVADFKFTPPAEGPGALAGVCLIIQLVIGFFATAGAAGVDFGTSSRDANDVKMGGLTGIMLSIIVAGGLGIIIVAGALGIDPSVKPVVFASLPVVSPGVAKVMLLLLAIGSMAPACFCSSIIGNSLSTMMPSMGRVKLTMAGATIGIALAATGVAGKLEIFFGLIGASFGPICGAIVADYLLSGRKWAGPREGVSIAGYVAWIAGFLVGICNNPALGNHAVLPGWHPTGVYSFIVGFVVYAVLAKAGLQGKTVELPGAAK